MKIILQAGHYGRTSGSTGAPGEADFNWNIANKVAEKLKPYAEVRVVKADPLTTEFSGDWDCFLSIHYDADIYGKGGYFVDFADPATDSATTESQRITGILSSEYGKYTGIINHPERSNINTRKYYMWAKLSAKTPCVIIECGVGQHKPDDYEVLFNQRQKVIDGIVNGLAKSLNINLESNMTDEQKRILEFLAGKTEGDVRAAFGALADSPDKDKQIQTLQEKVLSLDNFVNGLQERIVALESELTANLKLVEDWQKQVNTANKALDNKNKELESMISQKNQYKNWYEVKCDELKKLDKMTAWQHIKYGIKLLTIKN